MATPQITLTAKLYDLVGTAAGSVANPAKLRIALCGYASQLPVIAGTANLAKPGPYFFYDIGTGISITLWGNDQITPSGTYYEIAVLDGDDDVVQCDAYEFINGPLTIDLSNATPFFPTPPEPPIGGVYVVPINGGNPVFNGLGSRAQLLTLTQDAITTVTFWPPGTVLAFFIKQDSTGGRTITWPASFKNAPEINMVALGTTFFVAAADNAGNIYCAQAAWI